MLNRGMMEARNIYFAARKLTYTLFSCNPIADIARRNVPLSLLNCLQLLIYLQHRRYPSLAKIVAKNRPVARYSNSMPGDEAIRRKCGG